MVRGRRCDEGAEWMTGRSERGEQTSESVMCWSSPADREEPHPPCLLGQPQRPRHRPGPEAHGGLAAKSWQGPSWGRVAFEPAHLHRRGGGASPGADPSGKLSCKD